MSNLIVQVCKVDSIEKHPNADKLSIVGVKGWNCIVGLDQYKVNDLVVFIPPDCIIPPALIEKYNLEYLKKNGKTSSVKLRGFLSQGLIIDTPEGKWKEGDDVSGVLGITKWQPPEAPVMRGVRQTSKKKMNPLFSKYTDIENIKNYNNVFTEDDVVVFTSKIHGSNFRAANLEITVNKNQPFFYRLRSWIKKVIFKQTHEFCYGSHNVQITNHENRKSFYSEDVWGKIAERYNMKDIIPEDYIVYGEIYGDGIQDLTYGLKNEVDLAVFDVKYKDKYLDWFDVVKFCNERNFPLVPVLYIGNFSKEKLKECTEGKSVLAPNQMREGTVVKMLKEENNPQIGRKILKSINPEYLLRKNGTEFT